MSAVGSSSRMEEKILSKVKCIIQPKEEGNSMPISYSNNSNSETGDNLQSEDVNDTTPEIESASRSITTFPRNTLCIHHFIRSHEIEKLGKPERRLQIDSHIFRIIGNRGRLNKSGTLYRAIAQALTTEEEDDMVLRQVVVMEILSKWSTYSHILVPSYQSIIKEFTPEQIELSKTKSNTSYNSISHSDSSSKSKSKMDKHSSSLMRAYLNAVFISGIEGTLIELRIASKKYKFDYTVLILDKSGEKVYILNCPDEELKRNTAIKYYFLRSGDEYKEWAWEYLASYSKDSKDIELSSSEYPVSILNVIHSNKGSLTMTDREIIPHNFKFYPTVLSLQDDKLYGCMDMPFSSCYDLFSILSFVMQGSEQIAYQIQCQIKKEQQKGSNEENVEPSISNKSKKEVHILEQGQVQDVITAARLFHFSYTIYGLDEIGNLSKILDTTPPIPTLSSSSESPSKLPLKHYTFLTRTRGQYAVEWCLLDRMEVKVPIPSPSSSQDKLPSNSKLNKLPKGKGNEASKNFAKVYLHPLIKPYTEKKSFLGMKYRTLRKGARRELEQLLKVNQKNVNKKEGEEGEDSDEQGNETDENYQGDMSDDVSSASGSSHVETKMNNNNNNEPDSIVGEGDGKKQRKESFRQLFWKSSFLGNRSSRVAPMGEQDLDDLFPNTQSNSNFNN